MFNAIVSKKQLASTIDCLTVLVDEAKVHLNEDGIEIRAVDPANVGMTDIRLGAGAFESYEADGGVIGVDLDRLDDVVGMADSGQLIYLVLDEETRKLQIEIAGLEYTLALIDPDSIRQEPDIPELDLEGEFVLEGGEIARAVKAADLCSDHISIGFDMDEREFYFEAEGDTDDVRVTLDPDEDLIDGKCGESVRSLFSLDYMKDIVKAIDKNAEVELLVGSEFPVKMSHSFAEGEAECLYMLAPRIQSD